MRAGSKWLSSSPGKPSIPGWRLVPSPARGKVGAPVPTQCRDQYHITYVPRDARRFPEGSKRHEHFSENQVAAVSMLLLPAALSLPAAVTVVEAARTPYRSRECGLYRFPGPRSQHPPVITCAAAHNLVSGDQVQITGIVGITTTDNVTAFVNVLTPTTFSIFSDVNLSSGITGTGTYSSGGTVSQATDISGFTGDWTIRLIVNSPWRRARKPWSVFNVRRTDS